MTAEILDSNAALQAVASEWAALWSGTPAAMPFQHPAWLLPWWSSFGTGQPRVATWREAGTLRGILPAYILHENGVPKLLPIGAGTTDYLDALGQGASEMLATLLHRCEADDVHNADLIDVPPTSHLPRASVPGRWRADWTPGTPCPVLAFADIPNTIRRKTRMNRNRAARAGGATLVDAGPAGFDTLAALHQARWPADPAHLASLHQALPGLHAAGLLRLNILDLAGHPAAAILALLAPGRIFFYLSGYDPARSFVSPGTILLADMLDHAQREGRTEAHFLRGQESYKYAWGATDRHNQNGRLLERDARCSPTTHTSPGMKTPAK